MPGLPAVGTLSYNGYTFDGATHVSVTAHKVRDEAARTVIGVRYEITVEGIVSGDGGATSDQNMAALHAALSQDGQTLVFANKGFGAPVTVNGPAGLRDIDWGPKAEVLHWEPIGGSQACQFVWTVATTIPECPLAGSSGIMAMNYDADYSVDKHGDTTRKLSGYIQIAMTRGPGKTIPDMADKYRTAISPQPPLGYERTQQWKTSKNKSRLDFTITDVQIPSPNPYPADVTEISGTHETHWSWRNKGGGTLFNTIDLQIRPQRGVSGVRGWLMAVTIVRQRIAAAQYAGRQVYIDDLSIQEDIFGFPVGVRVGYRVMSTLKEIIADTGLFTQIGTNWQQWHASLTGSQLHVRGTSGLILQPNNDVIVDLCGYGSSSNNDSGTVIDIPPKENAPPFRNEYPTPNASWLYYRSAIIPMTSTPLVRHSILQAAPTDNAPDNPNGTGGFSLPYSSSATPDVIQKRGKDRVTVRLVGQARRAGFKIPRPNLVSIGGTPATYQHGYFSCHKVGNALGVPIYAAQWDLTYVLNNAPANPIDPPENVEQPDSDLQ